MFDDNSSRLQKIEAYSQVTEIPDWMFDETVAGYKNTGLILRLQKYPIGCYDNNSGRLKKNEANSLVTETPDWMFDYNSGQLPGPGLAVWFPAWRASSLI